MRSQPLAADPVQSGDLVNGRLKHAFTILGVHKVAGLGRVVRTFQPQAKSVKLVCRNGTVRRMKCLHRGGIFVVKLPSRIRRYTLRIEDRAGQVTQIEDPYRFKSTLDDVDESLLQHGSPESIYRNLGAHILTIYGVRGTRFSVWAPHASRVSVIGEFNRWDGRRNPMRLHPRSGIWEIFMPAVEPGSFYKYQLLNQAGELLPLKADPMANFCEAPPGNASIVYDSKYQWADHSWLDNHRPLTANLAKPVSIYEVHLGSWRRHQSADGRSLSYREHALQLVEYVVTMGFTHIELLPVTEHPFEGSWGYQPTGMLAPTQRYGTPDDFRYLVDQCHQAGLYVILDWVPAHFPKDDHALGRFDGTALYEHADPRKGEHMDWGTLIYNYERPEVVNFLIGSAVYWIEEFHIDALRVDAVASMLYLDYSRAEGEWLPNPQGGVENLAAVNFIQQLNRAVHARGASCFAEESTAWPGVSHPLESGGLGFTYKWNMGWMHDTLAYMSEAPLHRSHHHEKLSFGLVYAFSENFVLPLSHDEVVHCKGALLSRMPGDDRQKFANLRTYLGFQFGHPGKKLLFMGAEPAQRDEWNHEKSLDWHLLNHKPHLGIQNLVRDLNHLYRQTPALHQRDFDPDGFKWICHEDHQRSVLSWIRYAEDGQFLICISNFTPKAHLSYRIGVPNSGRYRERLNSDARCYGGAGLHNAGPLLTKKTRAHGFAQSIRVSLPALATVFLERVI
ncbi:MAG: 1,4-alpha-glucan branching protein GlgB [Gammaproteobacteria bacterium]|nr:1,4-alpha-glucan branching protein GlgB [Gammaproteobacteria bacterium]